ncbi:TraM recognition domain-containing protein [Nocardia puris]|uniref:type IV secretory system conjugative DNA transfer family protein n=1 Tax=Nocardia puris TaxID=208602 RepID=UPI00189367C4|nr:TraM recognition domain-containing protein [Nocardia puris]MBF6215962.1 TraM recognition domain-containing protein [Nocardia puris]
MARRHTRRHGHSGVAEEFAVLILVLALLGLGLLVWAALSLGRAWAGLPVTTEPVIALVEVLDGSARWPWQSTAVAVAFAVLVVPAVTALRRIGGHGDDYTVAARTMHRPRELGLGRARDIRAANQRLLRDAPPAVRDRLGPTLGTTLIGGVPLYVPAELGVTIAAGTRSGKTMAWAVGAVLSAWGPALVTSNKPDLLRHTAYGRERVGRTWHCDLQGVSGRRVCDFWVDLLADIDGLPAARKLAGFFVSGSTASAAEGANAKVDSYFDGGARELLALYLLAAACAGGDLLHVAEWLGRDQDETPALILRHHGQTRAADRIGEAQALYSRQRDGLYDMARRYLNALTDPGYAQLVTPPARRRLTASSNGTTTTVTVETGATTHQLPQFRPSAFVTSTDTLYAMSMAGPDGATPLTSALVGAIIEAALTIARARPDGRLAIPLLAVLDEAANCARISDLPNYYSYAGGCGIILMTILQVLEQGEELWGASGLTAMRAQSIEIYGGGIAHTGYLEQWQKYIGEHDVLDRSYSTGATGRQRTTSWRTEPILTIAQLAALPKHLALVRLPGHGPVLVTKTWWQHTEFAPLIRASLARAEKAATTPHPDNNHGDHTP